MTPLGEALNVALATVFTFYLKAHNYHWNVTGPDFAQFHGFFGDVYQEVWESVDDYAEHIRTLGDFPSGGLTDFARITLVQDASITLLPALVMIKQLEDDNMNILKALNEAHDQAMLYDDFGIINFIEDRIDYHNKLKWKLHAFSPAVM
jgi:starvation-inducible DNA-binding protein